MGIIKDIQHKRYTSDDLANLTPLDGEFILNLDNGSIHVGMDGVAGGKWKIVEEAIVDDKINTTATDIRTEISNNPFSSYLGGLEEAPTERADGSELQEGDVYFNKVEKVFYTYISDTWTAISGGAENALMYSHVFTADGETDTFAVEGGFIPDFTQVYRNGGNVTPDVDISDGANVVFPETPDKDDEILVVHFTRVQFADIYTKNETDAKRGTRPIVVDSDYQAVVGDEIWADTVKNGSFVVTLPPEPNDFEAISILDFLSNFENDNVILRSEDCKIMGSDEDYIIDTNNASFTIKHYNGDWRIM